MSAIYDPDDLLLGATGTRCFFSPREAREVACHIAELYGVQRPTLDFEAPIPTETHAVTLKSVLTERCVVGFEDVGAPIEILAHELAHVVYFGEGEDHHTHDDAFAVLTCLIGWQIIRWLSDTQWEYE